MKKVDSIQYLRGVSATLVVAFHAALRNNLHFEIGNCGVDIFFVISGFVMWLTTYKNTVTWKNFLIKRLRRILPAYWIATISFYFSYKIKPNFFYGIHIKLIPLFKSLIFFPYYNYEGKVMPVLWQGWTLNTELLFYAIFSLFLSVKLLKYRILYISITILTLTVFGYVIKPQNAILIIYTRDILIEFVFGIWLAWIFTNFELNKLPTLIDLSMLGVAVVIFMLSRNQFSSVWRGETVGIAAALIVFTSLSLEGNNLIPNSCFLKLIGDSSYSIYLWHTLVMIIIYAFWRRFGFNDGILCAMVLTVFSVLGGVIAYILVEKPLLYGLDKILFTRNRRLISKS